MRRARALLTLLAPLILTGCGYIHFGRLPTAPTGGDAAMATAYSNLSTEHKILKQELVLARKEGDTLRVALERAGSGTGAGSADLIARMNESSRELAALRASYAKLQAERSATAPDARALTAARSELEEKLAASLRNYTQLQEENARLKGEVDRTRAENLALGEQLKSATVQLERTQITLAQLNTDLIAQKEARARAEQSAEAVRTQLTAVMAHSGSTDRTPATPAPSGLQIAKAPPADSSPTAELRLSAEQLRAKAGPPPTANTGRTHAVQVGDTLEKIARQYYGAPDRWRSIYEANTAQLSDGQPLRAGMTLQIPEQ